MTFYFNIVGSGRHEGFNLPAYFDFAIRGDRFDWPNDGSVKRIHLPRFLFRKSYYWKVGK